MTDQNALIIIKPDPKVLAAAKMWRDELDATDKAKFVVDDTEGVIISHADSASAKRTELADLVDANAEGPTGIVEITFNGTEIESISTRILRVADPEEEPE